MDFDYHIIRSGRDAIDFYDQKRREKGLSQMDIALSDKAEFAKSDVGQTYARFYEKGDGKISNYLKIGCVIEFSLVAVPNESLPLFISFMDEIKNRLNDTLNETEKVNGKE